jgi:hypothetical protein
MSGSSIQDNITFGKTGNPMLNFMNNSIGSSKESSVPRAGTILNWANSP